MNELIEGVQLENLGKCELKEDKSSFNSLRKLENIQAWGNGTMGKLWKWDNG
jgi:hypothetical protein